MFKRSGLQRDNAFWFALDSRDAVSQCKQAVMQEPPLSIEMDREWYRAQIFLLEQQINRIQSGLAQVSDMSLGQILRELETCTRAIEELEIGRSDCSGASSIASEARSSRRTHR